MTAHRTDLPTGAVTFLFTDIEGSTPLWERHPEAMQRALAEHDRVLAGMIAAEGGSVFKTGGDGFCAAFPDPHRALAAAISAQHALALVDWPTGEPLRVRMGLHTGTAHARDGDYFGPTLNRAARVMDAGHGGQVLLSSTTQRLVVDELPPEVRLKPLGTHHLKGLDRSEDLFQVVTPELAGEFPPLRVIPGGEERRSEDATRAFHEKRWQDVHDILMDLETHTALSGEQHGMLAESLWWLGKHEAIASRFEAAHSAHLAEGDTEAAAIAAVEIAEVRHHELATAVSRSWERKAEKLLEGMEDSRAMGYLLRWKTVRAFDIDGDADRALGLATRVLEIARGVGDGDLETLATQDMGRVLVARGDVDEGMSLMDEAMLAAVAGDVSPIVVGRSYCNMLAACDRTGDLGRAAEWSQAAEAWCDDNRQAPYPGVCRIFKAEVMWQRGEWAAARDEVLRASDELGGLADVVGEAWYQYGEMLVRSGDDQGAEAAFQEALTRGRQPVPGYAILLARRGEPAEARNLLIRRLMEIGPGRLDRVKHLPTLVDLELSLGAIDDADAAAAELRSIADSSGSILFGARAERALGRVSLARGDSAHAIPHLTSALETFTRLGLPYDAALAHADLAEAYQADDSQALAEMERKVALAEFERLGAEPDAAALRG